jgi:hypothetical protein
MKWRRVSITHSLTVFYLSGPISPSLSLRVLQSLLLYFFVLSLALSARLSLPVCPCHSSTSVHCLSLSCDLFCYSAFSSLTLSDCLVSSVLYVLVIPLPACHSPFFYVSHYLSSSFPVFIVLTCIFLSAFPALSSLPMAYPVFPNSLSFFRLFLSSFLVFPNLPIPPLSFLISFRIF